MPAVFYGIGVGPGDPELLTLKAIKAMREADVIIAPITEKKDESTALAIARPYLARNTVVLEQVFPMVFDPGTLSEAWEKNRMEILSLLDAGKTAAFLTLGDPMLYSTFCYLHAIMKDSGYPVVVIPGIPSFCAAAARTGQPLALGDEVLSIVPATLPHERLRRVIEVSDSLALLKVSHNWPEIADALKEDSAIEDSVLVSKCGTADEEIINNLSLAKEKKINYLSLILAKKRKRGKPGELLSPCCDCRK